MNAEIKKYLEKHNACDEGKAYAYTQDSLAEVWDNCPKLNWLWWMIDKEDKKPDKELRLFAVWCARQVQHLMTDKRSIDALDVAERFAHGKATKAELDAARAAAEDAARAAAEDAARAARDAARTAWYAAGAARRKWDAALDNAQLKQFKIMIKNPFKAEIVGISYVVHEQ